MSHIGYVLGAWGVTLVAGGLYAASLLARGRRLSRRFGPPGREQEE